MFARAPQIPPIKIPGDITPSDTPEIIGRYVGSQLPTLGPFSENLWHGLLNQGQVVQYEIQDLQNGKTYWLYIGDTITVQFSDGSTMKAQFLGPYATTLFKPVDGSLRDKNGNDPVGAGAWSLISHYNSGAHCVRLLGFAWAKPQCEPRQECSRHCS